MRSEAGSAILSGNDATKIMGGSELVGHPQSQPPDAGDGPDAHAQAPPYQFSLTHPAFAVQAIDEAVKASTDTFHAALVIGQIEPPGEVQDGVVLRREVCRALTYSLHLALGGADTGCELNVDGAVGLLPAVRDVPEPVVQLWRAIAGGLTEPAAIAHFEDLLWCRRDGNAGAHAARAAQTYLTIASSGEVAMSSVEMLVRAWTLARQTGNAGLDRQVRARLAAVATDTLDTHPGQRPGILLPVLGALAQGPLRAKKAAAAPDPIDVDDLLAQAAEECRRGRDAATVAQYRRGRTQDPAELQAIAREEVAGYLRDAEAAPQPAVRMLRLRDAAATARDRGLADLERDTVTAMQNINPAELGLQTVTASSTMPPHVVQGWLADFTRPTDWRAAMDRFLDDDCPTGNIAALRAEAAATRTVLSVYLPPVLLASGLPKASATTPQEQEKHEMSFAASVRAENIGGLLAEGLRRLAERYGTPAEDDLVEYLLYRGGRDPLLARSIAKAFRHFWNSDFESCIHLAVPKFEAAARSLLVELDEGIYRVEAANAPGGYPGLYVLLNHLETLALDESWAYFFGWLLGGPWGANLRNDVAHGLPTRMSPAYAALALRAVCVLGVVAGPATSIRLQPAHRRDRDQVIALLSDLSTDAGPVGNLIGRLADRTEHVGWLLRLARLARIGHCQHRGQQPDA